MSVIHEVGVVPNQPREGTRPRAFRMPDELFEKADEKAKAHRETVSDVVRRALEDYVNDEETDES